MRGNFKTVQSFISKNLLVFLALYLAVLLPLSRYVALGTIGIMETLFVTVCAVRWKVKGGIFAAVLASALLLSSYLSTPRELPLHTILAGLAIYFVVGVTLGKASAAIENQKARLQEGEIRFQNLSEQLSTYFDLVQVMIVSLDQEGRVTLANRKTCETLGYTAKEIVGKNWFESFLPDQEREAVKQVFTQLLHSEGEVTNCYENAVRTRDGDTRTISWHNTVLRDSSGTITGILSAGADVTEAKHMESRLTEQLHTLRILYSAAQQLITEDINLHKRAQVATRICVEDMGVNLAWIGQAEPGGNVKIIAQYPEDHPYTQNFVVRWDETPYGQGPVGRSIRNGIPQIIEDTLINHRFRPWREKALQFGFRTVAAFPLVSHKGTFGTLILYTTQPGFFTPERQGLIQAFSHLAASVLDNALLFEETQNALKHIQALRAIDTAITGSLDPRLTFSVALDEITRQLGADAADILLCNPYTQTLEYVTNKGFKSRFNRKMVLRFGESLAGRVVLERRIIRVSNLMETWRTMVLEVSEKNAQGFEQFIAAEGFVTYYGVPLIAKRQVLGVLEVFLRFPMPEDDEGWIEFLETLANQTAIAIDNAILVQKLERTNLELTQAYDATIEGWAYALDLRDQETEGHSQRVTEMTLRIAQKMGVKEENLIHIRRGALLHDIGKMGIPDSILLKPGPLSSEEWEIMKKHPLYAYQMLSRIEYLRPALDIPYAHHEKWDGNGYPRGLKGEEIPLSARIFSVVDVFDALTSDRPYRKAWTKEEAITYIQQESGKHFDPEVVKVFLEMIEEQQTEK